MTFLASAFGGLRESHPLSLHPRARFFKKKGEKKKKKDYPENATKCRKSGEHDEHRKKKTKVRFEVDLSLTVKPEIRPNSEFDQTR